VLWAAGVAEALFSGFKRLFGEVVSAKRSERMVKETELKVDVRHGFGPGFLQRGILRSGVS
jgi:hypothetical protein